MKVFSLLKHTPACWCSSAFTFECNGHISTSNKQLNSRERHESDNTKKLLPPAQHTLQHKLQINIKNKTLSAEARQAKREHGSTFAERLNYRGLCYFYCDK